MAWKPDAANRLATALGRNHHVLLPSWLREELRPTSLRRMLVLEGSLQPVKLKGLPECLDINRLFLPMINPKENNTIMFKRYGEYEIHTNSI